MNKELNYIYREIDLDNLKITKVKSYKVHFKVKNVEFFIKNNYDCGESWSNVYIKRSQQGTGRNNTRIILENKCSISIDNKNGQTNKQFKKQFVKNLIDVDFCKNIY